jgi:hypothetical protein
VTSDCCSTLPFFRQLTAPVENNAKLTRKKEVNTKQHGSAQFQTSNNVEHKRSVVEFNAFPNQMSKIFSCATASAAPSLHPALPLAPSPASAAITAAARCRAPLAAPQQALYFFLEPQGHALLRPAAA